MGVRLRESYVRSMFNLGIPCLLCEQAKNAELESKYSFLSIYVQMYKNNFLPQSLDPKKVTLPSKPNYSEITLKQNLIQPKTDNDSP